MAIAARPAPTDEGLGLAAAPLVPLAVAFAAGIGAASRLPAAPGAALAVAGALLLGALVAAARARNRAAVACLVASVAALGVARGAGTPLAVDHVVRLGPGAPVTLYGRLHAEPVRFASDRTRIVLDVEGADSGSGRREASGRVQITLYGPAPPLGDGQSVAVTTALRPPSSYRNPGGFDHAAHLRRRGILLVASARADRLTALGPDDPPWPVAVRRWALTTIRASLPPASSALLGGLLLGDRGTLPREIDDAFRRAGAYHVLAVSGFNVALVASSALVLLAILGVPRRASLLGAALALLGFALVVGGQPSVIRATLMGLLVLAAALIDRESQLRNAVALAALALLAVWPGDLWDPGFQLSFAATAGIVHLAGPVAAWLAQRGVWRGMAAAAAASVAAQAGILPFMLLHFNQLSLIGPAANLAVVPLAALATVLGMLILALAAASEWAAGLLWPALWVALLALRAVVWLAAQVPGAMVHLPAPDAAAGLAWCLALALLPYRGGRRLAAGALVVTAVGLAAWPWVRPVDARLRVTVLDVGQGDAILVEVPRGPRLLVDGGPGGPGRFDVGERVVAPVLWNRPIASLDVVAVSHADSDHAGGLSAVLRHFSVREVWETGRWSEGTDDTRAALDRSRAARRTLSAGGQLTVGEALITVLGPAAAAEGRPNDASLVLRLDWRGISLLLTGDVGHRGEAGLLARGGPLRALVLKVAHHGSRSSTGPAFLEAVRPGLALISVGRGNPFRHPSREVLDRLEAAGARIYRTDRDGAIILETDGAIVEVTAWATGRTTRFRVDAAGGLEDTTAPGEHPEGRGRDARGAERGR